jgi:hypothetical protein
MIMENTQIDISNYEVADLNEIRRQAAKMQAQEMARLATAVKAWFKSHFTFGAVTHA